jgi:TetR/AcrR family transcriptional repressor of nem operon
MVMRYPVEQKAETHRRIVNAASRSFRDRGSEGQGIASLMKDLGLTHGGFYRHFKSKDDLYVAAVTKGLEESAERMIAAAKSAPKGQELRAIIDRYLSAEHLNDVAGGCVIATLAPEFRRQAASVRARISSAMTAYMNRLLPYFPGDSVAQKRKQFIVLFPSMAGVLMTARASSADTRRVILAEAKRFYMGAFGGQ